MFLKNYTSNVPVSETIHNIEKVLIKCGVSGITKEYGTTPGEIISVIFHIQPDPTTPKFTIRLPVNKERALDALWLNYADGAKLTPKGDAIDDWQHRGKRKKKSDFMQQAERTAWKIIQDWVEVQMSMIQTRQADFVEVFMPYLYDGKQTIYQRALAAGGVNTLMIGNG